MRLVHGLLWASAKCPVEIGNGTRGHVIEGNIYARKWLSLRTGHRSGKGVLSQEAGRCSQQKQQYKGDSRCFHGLWFYGGMRSGAGMHKSGLDFFVYATVHPTETVNRRPSYSIFNESRE